MRRSLLVTAVSGTLLACGGGGGETAVVPAVSRDSAGIAITEYPAAAWDAAPAWSLSPQPLAVIGGDPSDTALDLSSSQLGALLSDNRVLVSSFKPAQLLLFSADGKSRVPIGREGEGPGEYRFIARVDVLSGDTIVAHEIVSRKALLFLPDGTPVGAVQFPIGGTQVAPVPVGRFANGTWLFQLTNPLAEAPPNAPKYYRVDSPMLAWRTGDEAMDTLFTVPGALSVKSSIDAGDVQVAIARPLAYAPQSSSAISGNLVWSTPGDHFVITARDTAGQVVREVRMTLPERPVTEADRVRYKGKLREGLERLRTMGVAPPALIESEIAKVEATEFSEFHPAISQLTADPTGRLWVTAGSLGVDSVLTYLVFEPSGTLVGRVVLPSGLMMGANRDRVVMRREDEETGLVRFEVWGVQPVCDECPTATP